MCSLELRDSVIGDNTCTLSDCVFEAASKYKIGGPTSGLGPAYTARLAILVRGDQLSKFYLTTLMYYSSDVSLTKIPNSLTVKKTLRMTQVRHSHPTSHRNPPDLLPVNPRRKSENAAVWRKERITGPKWKSGSTPAGSSGGTHGLPKGGVRKWAIVSSDIFGCSLACSYIAETVAKDAQRYQPQVVHNPFMEDVHVDEAYLTGPFAGVQSVATGLGAVDDLLNTLSG